MKSYTLYSAMIAFLFFVSCKSDTHQDTEALQNRDTLEWADELAHEYIIVDGHVDLPYALVEEGFTVESENLASRVSNSGIGNIDFERAWTGGLEAPFMSIYIPARYQETGGAKEVADSLIDLVNKIIEVAPDKFAHGFSPGQVEENFKAGKISLPMGMENGAPVEKDLANVKYFFDRGIRYITLTHSKDNQICDSSYDTTRTWNGLSPFGIEVVKEMNRVGIMVDISHVSDSTFYQVADLTDVPMIASHSSCRHFTPDWERNMSDDMIKRLGEEGGVIMINYGTTFLSGEKAANNNKRQAGLNEALSGFEDDAERDSIKNAYYAQNPYNYATISDVADHIDHVVSIAGIDHVGLGSDFDGVGDSLPEGLKDASMMPNLIAELLRRGYSEEDIEKICFKNIFRVWNEVLSTGSSN